MPTKDRDEARALDIVRHSQDPARRAQALVHLGTQAVDKRKAEALLRRALDEAVHVSEPYLVVRQAAAALRVLQQRKLASDLSAEAERLIRICETESNPIRRGDALWAVALGVEHAAPGAFQNAIAACAEAFLSAHGYLHDYRLKRLASYVNRFSHDMAVELARAIHRPRERRRAFREIGESESL
jgi:hypothetical protein